MLIEPYVVGRTSFFVSAALFPIPEQTPLVHAPDAVLHSCSNSTPLRSFVGEGQKCRFNVMAFFFLHRLPRLCELCTQCTFGVSHRTQFRLHGISQASEERPPDRRDEVCAVLGVLAGLAEHAECVPLILERGDLGWLFQVNATFACWVVLGP